MTGPNGAVPFLMDCSMNKRKYRKLMKLDWNLKPDTHRYPLIGEWSWSSIFINPINYIPIMFGFPMGWPLSPFIPARMESASFRGPGKTSPSPIILILSNCFKGTVPKKVLSISIYSLIPVKVNQGVSTGGSRILNTANLVMVWESNLWVAHGLARWRILTTGRSILGSSF